MKRIFLDIKTIFLQYIENAIFYIFERKAKKKELKFVLDGVDPFEQPSVQVLSLRHARWLVKQMQGSVTWGSVKIIALFSEDGFQITNYWTRDSNSNWVPN